MPGDDETARWTWDPSLYAGSAAYYAIGRVPYPPDLVTSLAEAVGLDGTHPTGVLLDVGCGPGSLTLLLAPYVETAIGVDADTEMLDVAAGLAADRGITNMAWRHLLAEELPADLPRVRVITLAQSFHWMDQRGVASILRAMLQANGTLVHVHATTHWGARAAARDSGWRSSVRTPEDPVKSAEDVEAGPPWRAVEDLVTAYLGPGRRAGRGVRTAGPEDEDTIYRAAGFSHSQRIEVPGRPVERTVDEIVAAVHSLSWAAPRLFSDRLAEFDVELRHLLETATVDGRFHEQMGSIVADLWR